MRQRYTTLDGMRGAAAIAVVIYHYLQSNNIYTFERAALAVDFFFCLSGFVIAHSYQDRLAQGMSLTTFLKHRIVRLYPLFLVGLIIGFVSLILRIGTPLTDFDVTSTLKAFFLNSSYLPYFSEHYVQIGEKIVTGSIFPMNEPSWSLFFEFVVNIFFCFLIIRFSKVSFFTAALISIVSTITMFLYVLYTGKFFVGWSQDTFLAGVPRTLLSFFSGVALYNLPLWIKGHIKYKFPPIALVLSLFFILIFPQIPFDRYAKIFVLIFIIPSIVYFGSISIPTEKLQIKFLDYLGWISYPIYCLHLPVLSLYTLASPGNLSWTDFLLCFVITLLVSHFICKMIDEPIRKYLSNAITKKERV